MATKLKDIPFSISFKCLILMIFFGLIVVFSFLSFECVLNSKYLLKNKFYETNSFQQDYVRLSHNVVEKYLDLVDENTIIENNSSEAIQQDLLNRYRTINENLKRATSFKYILKKTAKDEIITNIANEEWNEDFESAQDYILQFNTVAQWDYTGIYYPAKSELDEAISIYERYYSNTGYYSANTSVSDVIYRLSSGEWTYYTAIDYNAMEEDLVFGRDFATFTAFKEKSENYIPLLILIAVLSFFMMIYLSVVVGKKTLDSEVRLIFFDAIPFEVQSILVIITFVPLFIFTSRLDAPLDEVNTKLMIAFFVVIGVGGLLMEYLSFVRRLKVHEVLSNTLLSKGIVWLKGVLILNLSGVGIKLKILAYCGLYAIFNAIAILILIAAFRSTTMGLFTFLVIVLLNLLVVKRLFRLLNQLIEIIKVTKIRAEGDLQYPMLPESFSLSLQPFVMDLNALQNGLDIALKEAIKGEKLKTELITNVSHDLKNPLTSIISYIDLLSKEIIKIQSPEDKTKILEYTGVLNKKSLRLKILIEDLVAASKASSGNLEVSLEKMDIHQFLQQCIGEKEEQFIEKDLTVVIQNLRDEGLFVLADANHLLRVLENLFMNIIKYSLPSTRVYVQIDKVDERVIVSLKNISNHPLTMDAMDLSKRFVRGDISRTTEGSGLGLSIVDSLMKLQNGSLHIDLDGDLFKAILYIPSGKSGKEEEV